jgi:hypothetical protein
MWCCFKRTDKRLERVDVCARAKRDAQRQMASMRHPDGVRIHLEWRASTNAHRPRQHSSMSSRNRNSSTLSAKELLVQALQSTSSSSSSSSSSATSSLKQVARVHALLPSDLFGPASSERAAAAALLVPRHQATVLMCAELALSSLRHAKKLLPALLRVLALLPLCDTRNVYSTQVTQGETKRRKRKKKILFIFVFVFF